MISTLLFASLLAKPLKPIEGPTAQMVTQSLGATLMGSAQLVHESKLGFKPGVSLLGAYVQPGASVALSAELEGGKIYLLTAGANEGADGIDVAIADAAGHIIKKDSAKAATVSVAAKIEETSINTYIVTNSGSAAEFICLSVMTDGPGYEIHDDNVNTIVNKVAALSGVLDKGDLHFSTQADTWCIYGGVVPQGEQLAVAKLPLEPANYSILGFGDVHGKTLDMTVLDDSGAVLGTDSSDVSAPSVDLPKGHGGPTTVSIVNKDGNLSLTLFALLRKSG